jgi:predicted dehydrogenase
MSNHRKIRMGMVGGGQGAFIGAVHRIAAAIDQQVELVCGAFSSNPETSLASGKDLYLPADRSYASFISQQQKPRSKQVSMCFQTSLPRSITQRQLN